MVHKLLVLCNASDWDDWPTITEETQLPWEALWRGILWHGASKTTAGILSIPSLLYWALCKVGVQVCSLSGSQCNRTNQPQDPAIIMHQHLHHHLQLSAARRDHFRGWTEKEREIFTPQEINAHSPPVWTVNCFGLQQQRRSVRTGNRPRCRKVIWQETLYQSACCGKSLFARGDAAALIKPILIA